MFHVSAIHGHGVEDLLRAALAHLPEVQPRPESVSEMAGAFRIAIIGRPNVGKSSIINALTSSERVIVSPIPGTTRDSVDIPFSYTAEEVTREYILIDTAGLRKTRRVDNSIEFFSVNRAEKAIERCDLAILVLDTEAGITEQDKKIADRIVEARKACIIVVNKWDLVSDDVVAHRKEEIARRQARVRRNERQMSTLIEYAGWVQRQLFFLDYAPVIFTSAHSGFNLPRLMESVRYVQTQLARKVPTALLNRTLNDAVEKRQPVSKRGERLKFFYATQLGQAPPAFVLFVNRNELFSDAYRKYLAGELRRAFGFEGCPIVLVTKPRPRVELPEKKEGSRIRRRSSRDGNTKKTGG